MSSITNYKERRLERIMMAEAGAEQASLELHGFPSEPDCFGSTVSSYPEGSAAMDMCIKTEPEDQDISHPEYCTEVQGFSAEEMDSESHLDNDEINTEIVMVKIMEDSTDLHLCSNTDVLCPPSEQMNSTCPLSRKNKSKTAALKVDQCSRLHGASSTKFMVNEAVGDLLQKNPMKLENSLNIAGDDILTKGDLEKSVVPVTVGITGAAGEKLCHCVVTCKAQKLQCHQCRKVFKTQSQLKIHLQTHLGNKYCCMQCGKGFSQTFRLKQHQLISCGKQNKYCQDRKTFSREDESKLNQLIQSLEKPYECSECGKSFSRGDHLKEHQRVHSGEKPYKCNECGKCFSRGYNLKQHLLIHSGEKSFQCAECGKSFSRGGILKRHLLVHSAEKPHKCGECGKTFSRGNQLKQHQLVHSGEKPYICSQCGKGFFHIGNLKQHQLVHSGEKPYECNQCGKCFSQGGTLKRHQLIHSGEKPYKDRKCGKSSALRLY